MKVLFFCPIWGNENTDFSEFVAKVKTAGYDGVEMGLPFDNNEKQTILDIIKGQGLALIGQHYETLESDFSAHKLLYEKRLYNLAEAEPLFINSQTGKDYFTFEQNAELINLARKISQETGVRILHETHRGKFSFAVHIVRRFLEAFEDLRLTLDISHWCNVAESLLQDQEEAVALALSRTEHIHTRVGFAEGPQIPDPRIPQWKETLAQHLTWWDSVIEKSKCRNQSVFTMTSEFGPFPYMQIHPETQLPLTNQWDVNIYMKDLLSARYSDG